MEIVLNNPKSNFLEIISSKDFDNILENLKKFTSIKGPLEAKIFVINELFTSHQLLKFKNIFDKINICSLQIYSNHRNTVLAGKSLRIDSNFVIPSTSRPTEVNLSLMDS